MLLETIPNLSTADPQVVATLARAAETASSEARLLDHSADRDHGRCVLTLAGRAPALVDAILALAEVAIETIDLRTQVGVHPRLGALDVVPFVALGDTPPALAIETARTTAQLLAERFSIPTLLYAAAATSDERKKLADHRRHGLVGPPDFGPSSPHVSAGVTLVGARGPLVAFNVQLAASPRVARRIARAIRASSGGLPGVQALGFGLESRGVTQVSTNLTDATGTGRCDTTVLEAFAAIESEARKLGASIEGAEIIGLVSVNDLGAPLEQATAVLGIDDLEGRLLESRLALLTERLE